MNYHLISPSNVIKSTKKALPRWFAHVCSNQLWECHDWQQGWMASPLKASLHRTLCRWAIVHILFTWTPTTANPICFFRSLLAADIATNAILTLTMRPKHVTLHIPRKKWVWSSSKITPIAQVQALLASLFFNILTQTLTPTAALWQSWCFWSLRKF